MEIEQQGGIVISSQNAKQLGQRELSQSDFDRAIKELKIEANK